MIIRVTGVPSDLFYSDPIGAPVFTDVRPPHREAGRINFRLNGLISAWLKQGIIDPASATPVLFTPGAGGVFPTLLIAGAGPFHDLSAPAVERTVATMTETFIQARLPLFALAARDFKRPHTPARDSAETILRGLAHGAELAGADSAPTIRLHWDLEEAALFVSELKRARHHLPGAKDWTIEREPRDREYLQVEGRPRPEIN